MRLSQSDYYGYNDELNFSSNRQDPYLPINAYRGNRNDNLLQANRMPYPASDLILDRASIDYDKAYHFGNRVQSILPEPTDTFKWIAFGVLGMGALWFINKKLHGR